MQYLTEIIVAVITTGGAVAVAWIMVNRQGPGNPGDDGA